MASRSRAGITTGGWLDDPVPTVDHLGELRQRLEAVARVGLGGGLLSPLSALLGLGRGLLRLFSLGQQSRSRP